MGKLHFGTLLVGYCKRETDPERRPGWISPTMPLNQDRPLFLVLAGHPEIDDACDPSPNVLTEADMDLVVVTEPVNNFLPAMLKGSTH